MTSVARENAPLRTLTLVGALAPAVVGAAVILGWAFSVEALKSVRPGLVAMNPLTAVLFLAAGGSLWLMRRGKTDPSGMRASLALALLVAAAGVLHLLDLATGLDIGLDRALFTDQLAAASGAPNRMAPTTALNFVLVGTALAILAARGRAVGAQGLLAGTLLFASLVAMGYLFGVRELYDVQAGLPMALNTAVAFLLLALGSFGMMPREGAMALLTSPFAGGAMARRLLPFVILVPLGLGGLRLAGERQGLFEREFGVAVMTVSMIVLLVGVILVQAGRVEVADAARRQAEGTLVEARRKAEEGERTAREAARVKAEFVANMSHEIRTPLNAVVGMTDLLAGTPLSERQREYVETIRTSSDHLLSIINNILDFSKIESGRLDLDMRPFDVRRMVESALDLVAAPASAKDIEVAYLVESSVPTLLVGDEGRLRQVLVNLLGNAIKFTARGEVVLTVAASPLSASRDNIHFAVRDTGIGIPPERLDRLFQPFSQVDSSTTRRFGGTGLGLAISKRLVEAMGGRIWVESESGRGSTFHVTFESDRLPASRAAPKAAPRQDLSGARVLIVDDNDTNRRILRVQTESWGMVARETGSPREALSWLERGDPFDLAIIDYHMPEMDGVALAREIRRSHPPSTLPILMLTSHAWQPSAADSEAISLSGFLTKPVKQSELFDVIGNLLHPAAEEDTHPTPAAAPPVPAQPLRILLAEDNATNQKVALRLLERLGQTADVVGNGREAIDALERRPYDVVLLDVQMPVMDGLEAARGICRRWPKAQRPRLVAMTAHALPGDRERTLEAGMDDYLSKPVTLEKLREALERVKPLPGTLDAPAVEPQELSRLRDDMGGDDAFGEILATYLHEAPRHLEAMRSSLGTGDPAPLERAAHTLKSTSRAFGARRLGALCEQLEQAAHGQLPPDAAEQVARIASEFEEVKASLEASARVQDAAPRE